MIWFSCKQCGKQLRQPETAGGSLVFCMCGQGNRVPWESTVPAPADDPSATPAPVDSSDEDAVPQRRRRAVVVRDPAYCFNHQDVPADQTCNDCGEHFCPACVVVVRGKSLCGPCKNFRLARLQRAPQVSTMAVVSLVLAYLALQEIERNPRVGGRGLAITGAATAVVGVVWSVTMFFVLAGKPFVD